MADWYALNTTTLVISGPYTDADAAHAAVPGGVVSNDHGYLEDQVNELNEPSPGGAVDLTGLLPLDGSRAMTGPLGLPGGARIDTDWGGIALHPNDDYSGLYVVGVDGYANFEFYFSSGYPQIWASTGHGVNMSIDAGQGIYMETPAGFGDVPGLEFYGVSAESFWVSRLGSLHWGDGTAAPDVTLERDATGIYHGAGVGDLRMPGDHALIFGLDVDYLTAGGYVGASGGYWQTAPGDFQPGSVNIHPFGAIDVHSWNGFVEISNGGLQFAEAGAAVDTNLFRTSPGTLTLGDKTGVGPQLQLTAFDGESGSTGLYIQNDDGDDWMFLAPWQDGAIALGRPGAGIRAQSPDGTPYMLAPPNGGGPATWVAA